MCTGGKSWYTILLMFLFLFTLLPIDLIASCISLKDRAVIPVVIAGGFFGVCACIGKFVFSFRHRIVPFSFWANSAAIFFSQLALPTAIIGALFFVLFRNDRTFKIRLFFPLVISFYMTYLPYFVIAGTEHAFSLFELVLKPSMYVCYAAWEAYVLWRINGIVQTDATMKVRVYWYAAAFVGAFVPAAIETLYLLGVFSAWWLTGALLYGGGVVFCYLRAFRRGDFLWLSAA